MENLSKALIMASAVLLVILIIGLMVFVLNTARSPIEQVADNMTEEERTLFNNRFTNFKGQAISGVEAKELINVAMQNTVEQIEQRKHI